MKMNGSMANALNFRGIFRIALPSLLVFASTLPAYAVDVPGAADSSRIKIPAFPEVTHGGDSDFKAGSTVMQTDTPESAKEIHLVLKDVKVDGVSAFRSEEISRLYKQYIGKDVTLDVAWVIADKITKHYRKSGYFLSAAFVPVQEVEDGIIKIKVIEGYIGKVVVDGESSVNHVIKKHIEDLKSLRPVTMEKLESFMLRINDLPGTGWFGSLESADGSSEDGVVVLRLMSAKDAVLKLSANGSDEGRFTTSINNYGSRYLGPYQITAGYSKSLLPLQQTSASVISSVADRELKSGTIHHSGYIWPDLKLFGSVTVVSTSPGYSLEVNDIESRSDDVSLGAHYQLIRQRSENLSFTLTAQGKNTHGDALSTPLTRDKVRVLRFATSYDASDSLYGYNSLNLTFSRGLSFLGGNEKGDLNLSRAAADPDFNKVEFSWGREQYVSDKFSLSAYFTGQMSSSPLFSSEEFGYGGFVVGRGYDPSEITGDSGAAFSIEISYNGLPDFELLQLQPFAFYDIGKVWNRDGTDDSDSGASAGFGMKIRANNTVSSTVGLAYPLTRPASSPLSGNGKNPRLMFEVSAQF